MKKVLLLTLLSLSLYCCSADPLDTVSENIQEVPVTKASNTFTVNWESNQGSSYIIFKRYTFKDCKLTERYSEVHREKQFNIQLEDGEVFELDIRREESVKNPEIYLNIMKGSELQYEREVESNGFVLQTYVDGYGNIKN